jgi:FtsZ-binding cell division protein ZapB
MMGPVSDQEADSLARLEERIHQTAELVARLRREKDAALADRETALREAAEARALESKLSRELETLRGERVDVRSRIEKLLAQTDLLNAG